MAKPAKDKWDEMRAKRIATAAARARYEHKRDALIAARGLLMAIDEERARQQLTKAGLANLAGMQPAAVRRLLTAEGTNPTLLTVIGVAAALGLEIQLKPSDRQNASEPLAGSTGGRGQRAG